MTSGLGILKLNFFRSMEEVVARAFAFRDSLELKIENGVVGEIEDSRPSRNNALSWNIRLFDLDSVVPLWCGSGVTIRTGIQIRGMRNRVEGIPLNQTCLKWADVTRRLNRGAK